MFVKKKINENQIIISFPEKFRTKQKNIPSSVKLKTNESKKA